MCARRYQEILAARGCQESLQTFILERDIVLTGEIKRGLIDTHSRKEICRWHEHVLATLDIRLVRIELLHV